jgi:Holliday junction resolvasome RuvABC endonuclease subunit
VKKKKKKKTMRVLAFDPGTTNLGWALVDEDARLVACGTLTLGSGGRSLRPEVVAEHAARAVERIVATHSPPDVVVVERQMRDQMIMVAQSLVTAALCFGIPATVVHPSTWYACLGVRGLGSHAANKRRNVALCCDTLRYSVPDRDHNACDAVLIALAHVYCCR